VVKVAGVSLAARRNRWKILVPAAVLIVAGLVAGGLYFRSRSATTLTEKDTIVLADFANTTGDTVFDETLKQGLSVELSQSPFLNILTDRRVSETLKLMGHAPGDGLTQEVTREICVRTNSKVMLAGSISSLGSQYVIGLKAVNCNSGDALAQEQLQAAAKEEVLKALDKAAANIRSTLGESLVSVQKFATPVEEATTSSLEALKAYSVGLKTRREKGELEAIPFYKRAIELDPNFALAYAGLGVVYVNLGQASLANTNISKAYELRNRVSEREKYRFAAYYYGFVTGELDKANQVYQVWRQSYPRDDVPPGNLGVNYITMGQWEKALPENEESLHLEPNDIYGYTSLGVNYLGLNRVKDAEAIFDQALAHKLDSSYLRLFVYYAAFLRNDAAACSSN